MPARRRAAAGNEGAGAPPRMRLRIAACCASETATWTSVARSSSELAVAAALAYAPASAVSIVVPSRSIRPRRVKASSGKENSKSSASGAVSPRISSELGVMIPVVSSARSRSAASAFESLFEARALA